MQPLRKLAGQTAIYGISSILGKVINYLLTPLHTSGVFSDAEFGAITKTYALVAILNVVYTYGLETAYFRFFSKEKSIQFYHSTFSSILTTSLVFSSIIFLFSSPLAYFFVGGVEYSFIIRLLAAILFLDAIVAIPFARLRLENKAVLFVKARISSIVLTVSLNYFFLLILPRVGSEWIIYQADWGLEYVFIANLLGNLAYIPFLWPLVRQVKFLLSWAQLQPILIYSFPIFLTGLTGMLIENLDKLTFDSWLPDNFYLGKSAADALGIYSASFKLSIFMMLGIQAFRFAVEPFFFGQAEDKKAPELFAKVMHYFVLCCLVVLVGVSLNKDLIASIFIREEGLREALNIVPFLLLGKLFYGIYVNLSIWFKLIDKTIYGTYFSVLGSTSAIVVAWLLIPILGYWGAAAIPFVAYTIMCVVCYFYGQKYFPIPYRFLPLLGHLLIAVAIVYSFDFLEKSLLTVIAGIAITIFYTFVLFLIERRKILTVKG